MEVRVKMIVPTPTKKPLHTRNSWPHITTHTHTRTLYQQTHHMYASFCNRATQSPSHSHYDQTYMAPYDLGHRIFSLRCRPNTVSFIIVRMSRFECLTISFDL